METQSNETNETNETTQAPENDMSGITTNYDEAVEQMRDRSIKPSEAHVKMGVLVSLVTSLRKAQRKMLSSITGLDLGSNQHLYEYLLKNLKMDDKDIIDYSIGFLMEMENPEAIMEKAFKEAFGDS